MSRQSSEIGVAIVGLGKMGMQHARVVSELGDGVELRSLVDLSPAARERAAADFPGVGIHSTLAEALERADVHAVHVCTPQESHHPVARDALERGCHIFVEKPFVPTGAEARELFRLAREVGRSICAGHQLLFEPAYRELAEEVGLVGDAVHLESYFAFAPSRGTPDGRPGLSPDEQLTDILPHPLYLLLDALKRAAPEGRTEIGDVRLGRGGTIHASVRRGDVGASLVVSLAGRPVASTLRLVGTGGEIEADLVRGIVIRQIGPGRGAIDKILAPFLVARQNVWKTSGALLGRVLRRKLRYPSLTELVSRWYAGLVDPEVQPPMTEEEVLEVVDAFEEIVEGIGLGAPGTGAKEDASRPRVVVTGGTGWLGGEVTRQLVDAGARVTVVARRAPASWERRPHVDYLTGDLAEGISLRGCGDALCVVHCAAETSGGTEAHERNSVRATRNVIEATREAGIGRIVHVSSLAVLSQAFGPVSEETRMEPDPAACGPYTWGKVVSERLAVEASGVDVRVVRPAAIVDSRAFVPPGKLGKRVGPLFVAVGGREEVLGVVELEWAGRAIAWMALHFEEAPESINLLDRELPTRGQLLQRLRESNPTLRLLRLPRPVLSAMGVAVYGLSRVLRPGKDAIDLGRVFARQSFENDRSRELASRIQVEGLSAPSRPSVGARAS